MKAGYIALLLLILAVALSYLIVNFSSHDTVDDVIDVSMLHLSRGRTVHLLGVQSTATWDSVMNDATGEMVWSIVEVDSARLRSIQEKADDQNVRLEFVKFSPDSASQDLHAYVWLEDDTQLNEWILQQGHGKVDPEVDHPQKQHFRELEKQAMQAGLGVWKSLELEEMDAQPDTVSSGAENMNRREIR